MVGNDESTPIAIQERSTQLQDTIRVTIQTLEELKSSPSARQTIDMSDNRYLRDGWIDGLREKLSDKMDLAGTSGVDNVKVQSHTDASLAHQPSRAFFSEFMGLVI